MAEEGQLTEQAKKQWEKIDAEGRKIINDLLAADKEGTVWLENTEPKFTRKKGTKMTKVAYDMKIKRYTHEGKEIPVEEPIRLDIPDSYIYFSFHPTTRKPYGFMQSCSVLLPSQIHMTKFTPHLGYFFQFNQRYGKN